MWSILRRCAAVLASAALAGGLGGAPAAWADDFSRVDREPVEGVDVVLTDGSEEGTALFSLRVADSQSVAAYRATPEEGVLPRAAYVESPWSDTPRWNESRDAGSAGPADRAAWIVAHSYPNAEPAELSLAAEVLLLSEGQAIAATQAALWHVLHGTGLDELSNDAAVVALYDHLVSGSAEADPGSTVRSLEITPAQIDAVAPGEPLGPATVTASGSSPVRVSLQGAPASWLVDARGEQVNQVTDGDSVYLDVDPSVPAGVVTLQAQGSDVPLPEGRLFTGRDGVRTGALVTAEPGTTARSTTATFTWNPEEPLSVVGPEAEAAAAAEPGEPEPRALNTDTDDDTRQEAREEAPEGGDGDGGLALTGTWVSGLLTIAGALVVSGLLILTLGRKRHR
ncbi:Cys-Gln thioester bond-forming surface protein [Nocardiopsis sp. LOL_012]|uniref:Cys-Gln thioester bond-forming surface protein n=1 Tax=Nocardiopsis sp. LOL_012 TaxID=3345409 RepID=UPI003A8ACACC